MDEQILAAITALGQRMDQRFDNLESRMDNLESRMDNLESRIVKLEAGQEELKSHIHLIEVGQGESQDMLKAVVHAQEVNAAEIHGVRVTTASIKAFDDFRKSVHDVFASGAEALANEG